MIIYKMNILIEMIIIKLKNMKISVIIYKKIQPQNQNNKIIILNKDNMIIIQNSHNNIRIITLNNNKIIVLNKDNNMMILDQHFHNSNIMNLKSRKMFNYLFVIRVVVENFSMFYIFKYENYIKKT